MYGFYLMHENTKVLKFNITVDINVFTNSNNFEIISTKYLPYPIKLCKKEDRENIFFIWFLSRYMDKNQDNFINITNFLHNNFSNREYRVPYFCSLYSYGMSLSDHYWLNPFNKYKLGGKFDYSPFQFEIEPTTYKIAREKFLNWSDDISKIQMQLWNKDLDLLKMWRYENISLNSPSFTTYGNKMKLWKIENGKIICEKFFKEKDLSHINKLLKISELKLDCFLNYSSSSQHSIKSNYFLKENEEYVTLNQILIGEQIELNDLSVQKLIKKMGCNTKVYKHYIKQKEIIKEKLQIDDCEFWDNLGFIINSKSQAITKIINTI